eukprot:145412-Chlamydomonas_euryale.AAC.4
MTTVRAGGCRARRRARRGGGASAGRLHWQTARTATPPTPPSWAHGRVCGRPPVPTPHSAARKPQQASSPRRRRCPPARRTN